MDQWEKKALAADSSKPKTGEPSAEKAGCKGGAGSNRPDRPRPRRARLPATRTVPINWPELREMLKDAESLGDGRYQTPRDARKRQEPPGPARRYAGKRPCLGAPDYGKSSPALLRDIAPIAAQAGRSTVVVLCDGTTAALGTVVRKDGYIVTKASEVHGKLACRIGSRELPATIVKSKTEHDLALLKVDANDLVPITWADGDPPVPGSWLITPAPEKDALGLGIVSVPARAIPDAPKILLRNRAIIGVMLDQTAKDARVQRGRPESARGQGRPEGRAT